ncbi:MAG: heme-binding protein, partial [Proteobacteria bacterium]
MEATMKIPLKEMLGSIPGVLGIRLEEEPNYEVSLKEGAFEIRRYDEMVLAQTTVAGTHEQAMDESFEILADYIFGGNHERQTMSMTTPVLQ